MVPFGCKDLFFYWKHKIAYHTIPASTDWSKSCVSALAVSFQMCRLSAPNAANATIRDADCLNPVLITSWMVPLLFSLDDALSIISKTKYPFLRDSASVRYSSLSPCHISGLLSVNLINYKGFLQLFSFDIFPPFCCPPIFFRHVTLIRFTFLDFQTVALLLLTSYAES